MQHENAFHRAELDDSSRLHEDGMAAHFADEIAGVRGQHL